MLVTITNDATNPFRKRAINWHLWRVCENGISSGKGSGLLPSSQADQVVAVRGVALGSRGRRPLSGSRVPPPPHPPAAAPPPPDDITPRRATPLDCSTAQHRHYVLVSMLPFSVWVRR